MECLHRPWHASKAVYFLSPDAEVRVLCTPKGVLLLKNVSPVGAQNPRSLLHNEIKF
jgi:hypothetical protein